MIKCHLIEQRREERRGEERRGEGGIGDRSEEHTAELQSHLNLVCRLLLEKKKRVVGSGRGQRRAGLVCRLWHTHTHCLHSYTYASVNTSGPCSTHLRTSRFFFFNDTATTEIYTLSLHDALPISHTHTHTHTQTHTQTQTDHVYTS